MSKLKCIKFVRDHQHMGLKEAKEYIEEMFEYAYGGEAVHDSETVNRIVAQVRYEARSEGFSDGYAAGWKDRGNE